MMVRSVLSGWGRRIEHQEVVAISAGICIPPGAIPGARGGVIEDLSPLPGSFHLFFGRRRHRRSGTPEGTGQQGFLAT